MSEKQFLIKLRVTDGVVLLHALEHYFIKPININDIELKKRIAKLTSRLRPMIEKAGSL